MSERDPPPTDPEHVAAKDRGIGVISGEAIPPDEHTRRVAAAKEKRAALAGLDPTGTRAAGDDETAPLVPAEPPPAETEIVPRGDHRGGGARLVRSEGPRRSETLDTVEAHRSDAQPANEDRGEKRPDPAVPQGAQEGDVTSRDLARRTLRERRRERDRRAERTALRTVLLLFAGAGALAFVWLNYTPDADPPLVSDEVLERTPLRTAPDRAASDKPPSTTATFEETPDIPALRQMASEGLTIGAEGLPEVLAERSGDAVAPLAALETCRFSYGVWEFSPNKRFRFLTTCGALEGQVLVGAYEIDGSVVRMSPLVDGPAAIVSIFHVEKPSRLSSEVTIAKGDLTQVLRVNQRVTSIRVGLEGEAFRDAFAAKNTLVAPGARPRSASPILTAPSASPSAPVQGSGAADPLLELLKDGRSR